MNVHQSALFLLCVCTFFPLSGICDEAKLKLYPLESFSVFGKVSGAHSGSFVEHVQEYGHKRVEFNIMTAPTGGVSNATDEKVITDGEWITRVDYLSQTANRIRNPMYESLLTLIKQMGGGMKSGQAFIRGMGGQPTGRTGRFAKEDCNYWNLPKLGAEICITTDGIAVWNHIKMGEMEIIREATQVRRNDPGPDRAYVVEADITLTEGPVRGSPTKGHMPKTGQASERSSIDFKTLMEKMKAH